MADRYDADAEALAADEHLCALANDPAGRRAYLRALLRNAEHRGHDAGAESMREYALLNVSEGAADGWTEARRRCEDADQCAMVDDAHRLIVAAIERRLRALPLTEPDDD